MKTATNILVVAHQLFLAPERETTISNGSTPFYKVHLNTVTVPKLLRHQNHKPGEGPEVAPAPERKASLRSRAAGWKRATQPI